LEWVQQTNSLSLPDENILPDGSQPCQYLILNDYI